MPTIISEGPHDPVILKLVRKLKEENPDHEIYVNMKIKGQKILLLQNGNSYRPDIIDETAKIVYEVHFKGERKEESYDLLPDGWTAVDVFITQSPASSAIVVRTLDMRTAKAEFGEL